MTKGKSPLGSIAAILFFSNMASWVGCKEQKRKRLGQPRQALEVQLMKLFCDFISWIEATRGARRWSWTWIIFLQKLST
jgi:hypothetical protein